MGISRFGLFALVAATVLFSNDSYALTCSPLYADPSVREVIDVHAKRVFQARRNKRDIPYNIDANVKVLRERIADALQKNFINNPEHESSKEMKQSMASKAVNDLDLQSLISCFPEYKPIASQVLNIPEHQLSNGKQQAISNHATSSEPSNGDKRLVQLAFGYEVCVQASNHPGILNRDRNCPSEAAALTKALSSQGSSIPKSELPYQAAAILKKEELRLQSLLASCLQSELKQNAAAKLPELTASCSGHIKTWSSFASAYRRENAVQRDIELTLSLTVDDFSNKQRGWKWQEEQSIAAFKRCAINSLQKPSEENNPKIECETERSSIISVMTEQGLPNQSGAIIAKLEQEARIEVQPLIEERKRQKVLREAAQKMREEQLARDQAKADAVISNPKASLRSIPVPECPNITYGKLFDAVFSDYTVEANLLRSAENNTLAHLNGGVAPIVYQVKGNGLNLGGIDVHVQINLVPEFKLGAYSEYVATSKKSGSVVDSAMNGTFAEVKMQRFMKKLCGIHFNE